MKVHETKGAAEGTGNFRTISSSPVPAEDLLKNHRGRPSTSYQENKKAEDVKPSLPFAKKFNVTVSSPGASSSKISQIKFCRFCNIGMAEEYLNDHELECWTDHLTEPPTPSS